MSWSRIQGTGVASSGTTTSLTATFGSPVTAGHLVVAGMSWYNTTSNGWTIKDSVNNSAFTLALSKMVGGYVETAIWYFVAPSGGASFSVTATNGSSLFSALGIAEYAFSGTLSAESPVSNSGTASTSLSAGTLSPTGSDLCVAVGASLSMGQSWTPGAGWTSGFANPGTSSVNVSYFDEYALNQSASLAAAMSCTVSGNWTCCAVAFEAAGAAVVVPYWHLVQSQNTSIRDTP